MALAYALEPRHPGAVLAYACACALSSVYGFLLGNALFGVIQAVWSLLAARRWLERRRVNDEVHDASARVLKRARESSEGHDAVRPVEVREARSRPLAAGLLEEGKGMGAVIGANPLTPTVLLDSG